MDTPPISMAKFTRLVKRLRKLARTIDAPSDTHRYALMVMALRAGSQVADDLETDFDFETAVAAALSFSPGIDTAVVVTLTDSEMAVSSYPERPPEVMPLIASYIDDTDDDDTAATPTHH